MSEMSGSVSQKYSISEKSTYAPSVVEKQMSLQSELYFEKLSKVSQLTRNKKSDVVERQFVGVLNSIGQLPVSERKNAVTNAIRSVKDCDGGSKVIAAASRRIEEVAFEGGVPSQSTVPHTNLPQGLKNRIVGMGPGGAKTVDPNQDHEVGFGEGWTLSRRTSFVKDTTDEVRQCLKPIVNEDAVIALDHLIRAAGMLEKAKLRQTTQES